MKKHFLMFPCAVLIILLWIPYASATGQSGSIQIENRNYANTTLSCDVVLSGEEIKDSSLFAAVFAESEQMKFVSVYPAEETARIVLRNVDATDYIKIMWLDKKYAPLSRPAILRMSDNGSSAYAKFAEDFLKLQDQYGGGAAASGSDNPYVLARLLVSCNTLPDLSGYNIAAMIHGPDDLYVLQFNTASEAEKCAEYLRTFPFVRYVEPDSIVQADSVEKSASASASQPFSWGAEATGLEEYAKNLQDRKINHPVVIAVVDSGADASEHEFLRERLMQGYDFIDQDDMPLDGFGHGTHVSGIIADCTPGMNVKIMPVRVLDDSGTGTAMYISMGIQYAADHGANIINLSLGLAFGHNTYVEEAIAYAVSKNITVVVAAGNQGTDVKDRCPAHIEECITVSAADQNWKRFALSNYGETVDIAAPGVEINSSYLNGEFRQMSGTSMAAPHVSAAAALLMEDRGIAQTPAQISKTLRDSAASLDSSGSNVSQETVPFGAGFLNLNPFILHPQQVITFYPNYPNDGSGKGTMTPQSVSSGSMTVLKPNAFSFDGYQFTGWNTKADGSGDAYADRASLTVTRNLSLYAQWKQGVYALLYTDGEMVFQNGNAPDPGKTLVQSYALPISEVSSEYAKWYDHRADIREVIFAEPVQPVSTALWFYGCENLSEIRGIENLDASKVQNMNQMFARCTSLKTLDLSELNTENVSNMRQMFYRCGSLDTIYASDAFSVAKVTDSDDMFSGCTSLVGGRGTKYDSNHTDATYARIDGGASNPGYFTDPNAQVYALLYNDGTMVFQYGNTPESGKTLTDAYAVDMENGYSLRWSNEDQCYYSTAPWNDQRPDIKTISFRDRIAPRSVTGWLCTCRNLTEIENIRNLDTSNVTSMAYMFSGCSGLTSLDLSAFDTSNVTNMGYMFYRCSTLTRLDLSGFDTSNVTNMSWMFSGCSGLTSLDVSGFDTSNVIYMYDMFNHCSGLTALDVSGFDTSNVTDMSGMFSGCSGLTSLDLSGFDTSNVIGMSGMFWACWGLTSLDVSGFDTSNVTSMSYMFSGCSGLTSLDVSGFNTSNVTSMSYMFSGCSGLTRIYASDKFVTGQVASSSDMFSGCTSLAGGAGTKYDRNHADKTYARIDGGASRPGYFTDPNAPNAYTCTIQHTSENGILGSVTLTRPFGTKETYTPPNYAGYKTPDARVIEWTGDQTITFTYPRNSYTCTVLYVSEHGAQLGSVALTRPFGTRENHTPPGYAGYNTPSAREIVWNTAGDQTITFTYSVSSVGYTYQSGRTCDIPLITFRAEIQYQNRTADSVQIRVVWTDTIASDGYDVYSQNLNVSVNGIGAGTVTVAGFNAWGGYVGYERSSTGETGWITVPVDRWTTSVSVSAYHYQANYNGTDMVSYGVTPYSATWTVPIPAF